MLRFVIVEDEKAEAERLRKYIESYCSSIGEKAQIDRYEDGASFLSRYTPGVDVVFMDIAMPGMDGMETAARLRERDRTVVLIFVTTLSQYAARGYEVDALDFIVKPFSYQDLSMRLRRALSRAAANARRDIRIRVPSGFFSTDSARLLYVEVSDHNLIYHMTDGELTARGTMAETEAQLAPLGFLRCNACYLVNPRHIVSVRNLTLTVGKDELKISKSRKQSFLEELTRWYGEH